MNYYNEKNHVVTQKLTTLYITFLYFITKENHVRKEKIQERVFTCITNDYTTSKLGKKKKIHS